MPDRKDKRRRVKGGVLWSIHLTGATISIKVGSKTVAMFPEPVEAISRLDSGHLLLERQGKPSVMVDLFSGEVQELKRA